MTIPASANPLLLKAGGGDAIERSLRFNSSDSAYLSRTPSTAGNRKTWTWAGWVKRSDLSSTQVIFASRPTSTPYAHLIFLNNNILWDNNGTIGFSTNAVFRDPSSWYHIVFCFDSTQATSADRTKLYVNGIKQTFSTASYPSINTDGQINTASSHTIGRQDAGVSLGYFNGYLADIHFIDGQALDPTSFGEFDTNGIWQPIAYSGTYGTNGFHLDFSDNSTAAALGTDTSGNGNTWTVNNISVTAGAGNDSLVDFPTNGTETDTGVGGEVRGNYCTLNPLTASSVFTLTNGNLDVSDSGSPSPVLLGSIAVNSGKWYWEVTLGNATAYVGAAKPSSRGSAVYLGQIDGQFIYNPNGINSSWINGAQYNYSTASLATTGDIIGVALDFDANQIVFYKNGVSMGVFGSNVLGSDSWSPAFKSNQSSSATFNFGQRPFAYAAPSGFKALCTANLPAPVVTKPSEYMDVKLYTGNGGTQTISGLEFSPDLVWIKSRNVIKNNVLVDIVRGGSNTLFSDSTNQEQVRTSVTSFNSDGFVLGDYTNSNATSATYVAWTWDAGSSTVTNTDGSITSTVRANPSAGFSIVTYTGTGVAGTIGHGLGVSPKVVLIKQKSGTQDWYYFTTVIDGSYDFLYLSTTNVKQDSSVSVPSSSVFNVGTVPGQNGSGSTYVAYCFAPVSGYSSFGSYTGNGSADGPFVFTNHRPRWILLKRTDTTSNWTIIDTAREGYNVDNDPLYPNLVDVEGTTDLADILSNGFKLRSADASVNANAGTYIYASFAEQPFSLARAR